MQNRRSLVLTLGAGLAAIAAGSVSASPRDDKAFHPGEVWKDDHGVAINAHGGGLLLHGDRYYWFGEHKVAGEAGNTAQVGVHVYSSSDLYSWRDDGIALKVTEDDGSDIVRGCLIERPKVLFNAATGKFVMWFHLEMKGQGYKAARAAVAISDAPAGPYTYLYSVRPNAGQWPINVTADDKIPSPTNHLQRDFAGGQMARDMTLYLDDDGKAYLVASSEENQTLHVSQLSEDFLHFSGIWSRVVPGGGNEAPAIFKHDGKYFMITSGLTGWAPNAARSFVADSVLGPWTPLGNPVRGTETEKAITFGAQSTYVLPYKGKYIFMADRWNPKDAIDGRYVWLPIEWENGSPTVSWKNAWSM